QLKRGLCARTSQLKMDWMNTPVDGCSSRGDETLTKYPSTQRNLKHECLMSLSGFSGQNNPRSFFEISCLVLPWVFGCWGTWIFQKSEPPHVGCYRNCHCTTFPSGTGSITWPSAETWTARSSVTLPNVQPTVTDEFLFPNSSTLCSDEPVGCDE